jgi:hypothetical protein
MRTVRLVLLVSSLLVCVASATAQPYKTEFGQGEILVTAVKRTTDDTVLIKGSIKNTSTERYSWHGSKLLQNYRVIDVRLQDLKSKRQFEQITVDGKAVGSSYDGSLDAGESATFWARVTAPPKDVKEVSILFGGDAIPIDSASISE